MRLIKSVLLLLLSLSTLNTTAQVVEVSYSPKVFDQPFSGNVLLYLSKDKKSPKNVFVGAELLPVYRVTVKDLQPNEKVVFDDNAIAYPTSLSNIERGEYYFQAVFDRQLNGRAIGNSVGNIYSQSIKSSLSKNHTEVINIVCDQLVEEYPFPESQLYKELKVKSSLLSSFHNKDIFVNAAVALPDSYFEDSTTSYPVVFHIYGFGANYNAPLRKNAHFKLGQSPAISVFLDGNCLEGHTVYANSDINGPWGDALVKEFIPALSNRYRTNGANLLTGHSSGGWATLWLQVNYPKTFIGTWSSSPDPVDFRNLLGTNIYEAENLFVDKNGNPRYELTIAGIFPIIKTKDVIQMERVIYRGEQMHSLDAVFGHRNKSGQIIRLADPESGAINSTALPYWERYDISLLLRSNWIQYQEDLKGKIRISIGDQDNFYLNKAVHLFEKEMVNLNAQMEFEYFPGDHFTIFFDPEYMEKGRSFLTECYDKWKGN